MNGKRYLLDTNAIVQLLETAKINDCALVSADDDFKKAEGLPRLTYTPS